MGNVDYIILGWFEGMKSMHEGSLTEWMDTNTKAEMINNFKREGHLDKKKKKIIEKVEELTE